MSIDQTCLKRAVFTLVGETGLPVKVGDLSEHLTSSVATFESLPPEIQPSTIITQTQKCASQSLKQSYENYLSTLAVTIGIIISLAVICVTIIVVFALRRNFCGVLITLLLSVVIVTIVIVVGASPIIFNLDRCLTEAETNAEIFRTQTDNRIQSSLCAY